MRLSLDALLVLDSIDRNGSFAAAAEALHRVPSAVSYAVQKLEEDLGVKVFDRVGHRASLTPAGAELLQEGRVLLRAAQALEARTKRVASGWEAELRIAVDDLVPLHHLYPLLAEFYRANCGTRIRLSVEVLGGCWEALVQDRADLIVGAAGEGPSGGGYHIQPWAEAVFLFAVAPAHPLAAAPEPLTPERLLQHRAVSVADSSRSLPPRTVGLLDGQDVLSVPTMQHKIAAQRLGLGVGFLARHLLHDDLAHGRLLVKETLEARTPTPLSLAWRSSHRGRALAWFVDALNRIEIAGLR